jgi:hypothetical protein
MLREQSSRHAEERVPLEALYLSYGEMHARRRFRIREVAVDACANNIKPHPLFEGENNFHMTQKGELVCSPSCRAGEGGGDISILRGVTFSLWYYTIQEEIQEEISAGPALTSAGTTTIQRIDYGSEIEAEEKAL